MHNQVLPPSANSPLNEKIIDDSIKKLDSLANELKITDNSRSHYYARAALSLAIRSNLSEGLARAYLTTGIAYYFQNSDSAYFYYTLALRTAERFNLGKLKPYILYNLSMLDILGGNIQNALIMLDSTLTSAERVKDFTTLSNAFNSIGNIKRDLKDWETAKRMFDTAYRIADKYLLNQQKGVALASLAKLESDPFKAALLQRKAIDILKKQKGTEEEIARILINLGNHSLNSDTAIECYESAIAILISGKYPEIEIATYNNLAYSLIEQKDYSNAKNCLVDHAIPLALKIDNSDWLSTLYDSYAELLHGLNKDGEAYNYEKRAVEERDKADRKQASSQVRLLAAQLDLKNKELRIHDNERELQVRQNRINRMKLLLIIGALIIIIISVLTLAQRQRNKVRFQNQQINSARNIIVLEESLKGRLAMELHDLVAPLKTGISHEIESIEFPDTEVKDTLVNKITIITESIRQISHRMNRVFMEQLTFTELIKGLCEDMQKLTSVPIKVEINERDFDLSEETGIHIFRIIQELLTNAIKYVKTGIINISIVQKFEKIYVLYRDDGPGFDMQTKEIKGLGLLNIKERAKLLGGVADLKTEAGKGTSWVIRIPVSGNKKRLNKRLRS